MKAKRKIFLISSFTFFLVGGFLFFTPNKKKMNAQTTLYPPVKKASPNSVSRSPNSLGSSHEIKNTTEKFDYCQTLRDKLPPLEELKKTEVVSERFINIHKLVNGSVFRLRFFYKNHAEAEIPSYLLYIEDPDEVAHLMEATNYNKGPEYSRIENARGEIIYTEKGISVGQEDVLFLHYVNSKLKGFQGTIPELDSKAFIDCRF